MVIPLVLECVIDVDMFESGLISTLECGKRANTVGGPSGSSQSSLCLTLDSKQSNTTSLGELPRLMVPPKT